MKKVKIIFLIASVSILFFSCTNKTTTNVGWTTDALAMPAQLDRNKLPDPNSEGARLVDRYCSQCHGIPSPGSHSASDWVPVFRRMILRMERSERMGSRGGRMGGMMGRGMPMGMMGSEMPSEKEQAEMLHYLQANALKATTKENLPEPEGDAAALYAKTCSHCHALPSPGQHTAAQWPAVVERMRKRMKSMQQKDITDEQAETIIKYLQRSAGNTSN